MARSDRGIQQTEIRAETLLTRRCKETREGTSKALPLHNYLILKMKKMSAVFHVTAHRLESSINQL